MVSRWFLESRTLSGSGAGNCWKEKSFEEAGEEGVSRSANMG
jgi:hypothetical protein